MNRFLSIILMLGFFLGDTGVTFATHYCGGNVVETHVGITKGEVGCGMEKTSDCEEEKEMQEKLEKHCCQDEYQTFQVSQDYVNSSPNVSEFTILFVQAFTFSLFNFEEVKNELSKGYDSSPPLSLFNNSLSVFFQVFRL